jgi:glutamate synthase domain-containing protein 1/glutamate synthase domain-containing protein 3
MSRSNQVQQLMAIREAMRPANGFVIPRDEAAEGGCGVIGLASSEHIAARTMLSALVQMRNRGNGKGGGIAAAGLNAEQFGVSQAVLENDYLLAVAYLDDDVREELEQQFIHAPFHVDHVYEFKTVDDWEAIEGLEVRPPDVVCYFVRLKDETIAAFREQHDVSALDERAMRDEIVYQNTFRLNTTYYHSHGDKRAFVLSHARNLLVLKMVGYGDDVIRYYQIEDLHAHVWIGHHRYPTKGRVWHPGGAHPFIGMNEALVHNGDFANHASISEYLAQRNIYPLYLTDTEVAVQVFDLLKRTYAYPMEYVIEAMAPTTERDFHLLPEDKQHVYAMLQQAHMHSSPDGPWFFLIAQSDTQREAGPEYSLMGITDTSMLRPQVFAYQEREMEDGRKVAIGFAASEKQAIDAALDSLSEEDGRFWSRADRYWNARGGSHTDGGAFQFSVSAGEREGMCLTVTDKFGKPVAAPVSAPAFPANGVAPESTSGESVPVPKNARAAFNLFVEKLPAWNYGDVLGYIHDLEQAAQDPARRPMVIEALTLMMDRRYATGGLRRSSILTLLERGFARVIAGIRDNPGDDDILHGVEDTLPPADPAKTLVIDARGFTPEDETSLGRELDRAYEAGFRRFIVAHARGHRFIGNGFGPDTHGVRIDVYGSPGDYLASGMDGMQLHVHNNAQDQLAQIMKAGTLVVHGDVGQTFMYGAKGGHAYILGNAAGRPLINAVGKPRVVINGTCLDYLAESFMAGDPLDGGGFVVLNGLAFNEDNAIIELDTPYPGGNLFSLASGGAIYLRDPHGVVSEEQLNGGQFVPMTDADWALILPHLEENERLFGIPVARLLAVDGAEREPAAVYRKIRPADVRALQAEEAWVAKH